MRQIAVTFAKLLKTQKCRSANKLHPSVQPNTATIAKMRKFSNCRLHLKAVPGMIKLITFDLDNTLWEIDPVIVKADHAMREWIEQQVPEAVARLEREAFKTLRQRVVSENPDIAHKPTYLRKKMLYQLFRDTSLSHEQAEHMSAQAFEVFFHHRNQVQLFHDGEAMLQELSRDYRLIALTNGNAHLDRVGIGQYFVAHFNADRVARPKPHADMFLAALEFAGVAPQECVHIGDHPHEDVDAAAALGFHTIWFRSDYAAPPPDDFQPQHTVTRLAQIPATIRAINAALTQSP